MSGPLSVALTADISAYERAMARARDVAVRHSADITRAFIGAAGQIDGRFLQLANGPGMTALARLPQMAKAAVAGFLAFEAVKFALNETDRAAKAAQERLEALVKIGAQAQSAAVGTSFLQGWTGQAKELNTEVTTLTGMLERAREASTVRIGEGDGTATSAMLDRLKQNVMAGNIGPSVLERFIGAEDQEKRIRIVLDLLEQMRAKGQELAAFDLGKTFFGPAFEQKLRDGVDVIGRMRASLDGLTVAGGARIVPAEEIARAQAINDQLERSRDLFANALRPLQEDMAKWQGDQLAGYANLVEMTAGWASALGGVYERLHEVGALIERLGNASIWNRIYDLAKGAGLTGNWGGTGRGVVDLTDADRQPLTVNVKPSIAPRNDRSKALPSLRPAKAAVPSAPETDDDGVERYIRQLQRSNDTLQAEVDTFGKSTKAREQALAIIKAEAQAREDVARGKRDDATLDDDERQRILAAADATATLKDKLEGLREAQQAWKELGATLSESFKEAVIEGKSLGDVVQNLMKKLEGKAIDKLFEFLFSAATGGTGGSGNLFATLGKALGFAEGGYVTGPGSARSDSIPARLSNGEFVVNAAATAKHRAVLEAINAGRLPAFANGGYVGAPSLPAATFKAPAAGPAQVITLAPSITLQAQGGTREQNADLARQTAAQVRNEMRGLINQEIRAQLRPGGMLNG